jgi:hypothetical protein
MPKRLINEKAKIDPANKAMVLDQWMTPPCAIEALIALEREHQLGSANRERFKKKLARHKKGTTRITCM